MCLHLHIQLNEQLGLHLIKLLECLVAPLNFLELEPCICLLLTKQLLCTLFLCLLDVNLCFFHFFLYAASHNKFLMEIFVALLVNQLFIDPLRLLNVLDNLLLLLEDPCSGFFRRNLPLIPYLSNVSFDLFLIK